MTTAVNSLFYAVGLKDEVKGTGVFAGAINLKREPKTGLLGGLQGEDTTAVDVAGNVLFLVAFLAIIPIANGFDEWRQSLR